MGNGTAPAKTPSPAPAIKPRPTGTKWRYRIIAAGLVLWITSMALRTGVGTFIALWNVVLFIGALAIISLPTRTVTLLELVAPFSLGGTMVGLAVLAGWIFNLTLGPHAHTARAFFLPPIEEALKLCPVLLILWRQRQRRAWTFGATDILLLAAASGSAFYWMEESFIIHNQHSWRSMGSFPTTDVTINFVANHAIWTSIAGLTIGIALLLRGSRLRMTLIAVSGYLWSALDHAFNNYNANFRDATSRLLRTVTGNGRFSLYIFLIGICVAVGLDLYFVYFGAGRKLPAKLPGFPSSWNQAKIALRYLRLRHRFAYAGARCRSATEDMRSRLTLLGLALRVSLRNLMVITSVGRRKAS